MRGEVAFQERGLQTVQKRDDVRERLRRREPEIERNASRDGMGQIDQCYASLRLPAQRNGQVSGEKARSRAPFTGKTLRVVAPISAPSIALGFLFLLGFVGLDLVELQKILGHFVSKVGTRLRGGDHAR